MTASPLDLADGQNELEMVWRSLPVPTGQLLEAQRLVDWPGGPVLAAIDGTGTRHLLIALPGPEGFRPPRSTRGLRIETRQLRIQANDSTWIDLSCHERALHRMFSSLTSDILHALSTAGSADPGLVNAVAERWRKFWSVSPDALGRDAQLGLLGELWLLTRWLPALTLSAVRSWRGPLGARHDFSGTGISVEVKTSGATAGPTVHRIGSLDQLSAPVSGSLYLLSLRFISDPLGDVNLDALIAQARHAASRDDLVADELDQRLASAGWAPMDRGRYEEPWRLSRQVLYEVRDGFPRLTPESFGDGLPPGITDVGYALDMAACDAWRVESAPSDGSRLSALAGH